MQIQHAVEVSCLDKKKYTMDNKAAIATIYTELTQFNVADTHAVG